MGILKETWVRTGLPLTGAISGDGAGGGGAAGKPTTLMGGGGARVDPESKLLGEGAGA